MKASDLDQLVECWICGGDGEDPIQPDNDVAREQRIETPVECRFCGGDGEANHYGPNHPHPEKGGGPGSGRQGYVIMTAEILDSGALHVSEMPINSQSTGGFNERYGDSKIEDTTTGAVADHKPDMMDQYNNRPLGTNGPYEIYGTTVDPSQYNGGPPSGPDLGMDTLIEWLRDRQNDIDAQRLETIQDRVASIAP